MDAKESLAANQNKLEVLNEKIIKQINKNEKLKRFLNSGDLVYKTFYSTAILILLSYIVLSALTGIGLIYSIIGCFPAQLLNAAISYVNALLREKYVKFKISSSEQLLSDLKKEKNLCLEKINELEQSMTNDFVQTEEFSKKELLDSLRSLSSELKNLESDEQIEPSIDEKKSKSFS